MTLRTNTRIAGITFLVYIVAGILSMVLSGRATGGEGVAARLASIARHATDMRLMVLLSLLTSFCAVVLGVTLHAITREQDPDLAMLGMVSRVIEGTNGVAGIPKTLALLWLGTATGMGAPDAAGAQTLGAYLLRGGTGVGATCFAVGSTLFSWLLLRGRMIPAPLAWLGVASSAALVLIQPLQLAGLLGGPVAWSSALTWLVWLPMLVFEVTLAGWLILKGVATPVPR